MSRFLKSTLLIFVLALSVSNFSNAQSIPGISEPVILKISPQYPKPNTSVTITAQSFSTDLNRAFFTWISNGETIKEGIGATSVTIPAGESSVLTTISVIVVTNDIGTISQTASWRPADVTLLWKTDGYLPPFYKGKALELYGSSFRVVAVPEFFGTNGRRIDPKTLIYTWKKNNTIDANQSGYGKDSFTSAQTSYVRGNDTITVEVSNNDGTFASSKSIAIAPGAAEIIFYEDSPLYGVSYETSLSNSANMNDEEITIRAEPFHVSTNNSMFGLSLDWSINGASVSTFKDKNKITLRKTGFLAGQTPVGLLIQHQTKILQGGNAAINILQ